MNKPPSKHKLITDSLNKAKSIQRKEEILIHLKPVNHPSITKNKKKYTRKLKHKNKPIT